MRRQIAVLMCAISFDNQRKILEGIMACAKRHDMNVFVFTCFVDYSEISLDKQGAFRIMELPDYTLYDGVIVVKNTIQYADIADYIIGKVRESGVPSVCIDEDVEGMHCVGISDYQSMRMLMKHMMEHHNKGRICYVTGRIHNREGRERLRAYEDTLREAAVEYGKDDIFYGDYSADSGRQAAEYFIRQRGIVPEAIICANDSMAIGVCSQLKLMGYRVPEDIMVTGFDGDELAHLHMPQITTVDRNQYQLGYEAVSLLAEAEGQDTCEKRIIPTRLLVGNSCGCRECVPVNLDDLRWKYVEDSYSIQQAVDSIKNMSSDFTGVTSPEELLEALKKYVKATDMQLFYVCLCNYDEIFCWKNRNLEGRLEEADINLTYTEHMQVALAYENGEFKEYGNIHPSEIVPAACKEYDGCSQFIVTPIFYQKLCFGYCVSCNSNFPLHNELFYTWVMNIGIGLENIRKQKLLKETVDALNGMWAYDMLTHVYNRAGFYHYAEPLLKRLRQEDGEVFLMFLDIDGLKHVNDTFGHNQGDIYIRTVAEALQRNAAEGQLVMRYGGDEFVVLGRNPGDGKIRQQISDIHAYIDRKNREEGHDFHMGASIGTATYHAREVTTLNEIIELADEKMYQVKRAKRVNSKK